MPNLSKPTLAWTLPWDADWVTSIAFVGPKRDLVAGNNLGHLMAWHLPEKPGPETPPPILRLEGHTNCVTRLLPGPDGRSLLSASYDHTLCQWELDLPSEKTAALVLNGRAIEEAEKRKRNGAKVPPPIPAKVRVLRPTQTWNFHQDWIVGLDQTSDGQTILSGDEGGEVFFWDRKTGKARNRWRVQGWVHGLAMSPDGQRACIGERVPLVFDSGRHAGLKLWDTASGKMVKDLSGDFKGMYISAVAYAPAGDLLAVGRGGEVDGLNGTITLLEASTGKKVRTLSPAHQYGVTDLVYHPDGIHLASSGRDTVVRIWNSSTGALVAEAGKPRGGQFKDWIHAVDWSPDGTWLAGADMAGSVQVWHFPV